MTFFARRRNLLSMLITVSVLLGVGFYLCTHDWKTSLVVGLTVLGILLVLFPQVSFVLKPSKAGHSDVSVVGQALLDTGGSDVGLNKAGSVVPQHHRLHIAGPWRRVRGHGND